MPLNIESRFRLGILAKLELIKNHISTSFVRASPILNGSEYHEVEQNFVIEGRPCVGHHILIVVIYCMHLNKQRQLPSSRQVAPK